MDMVVEESGVEEGLEKMAHEDAIEELAEKVADEVIRGVGDVGGFGGRKEGGRRWQLGAACFVAPLNLTLTNQRRIVDDYGTCPGWLNILEAY